MKILLTVILFGWSQPVLAQTKNYVFQCKLLARKMPKKSTPGLYEEYREVTFRVDTSDLPDKQVCGKSYKECSEAGFKGFIEKSDRSKDYINYPTLIVKECLNLDSVENPIKMEISIIPHLNRANLSISGYLLVETHTYIDSRTGKAEDLFLKYVSGATAYLIDCESVYEKSASIEGNKDIVNLSYDQTINTCD